ncbi:hypothetical protein [Paenibacillus agricola]|uniref:hypothetical protein n=1 Tax=Paenibacillus agricola TaxID=2716264 RepID=UPI001A9E817E|nr:hypothetical protein [Paenibacillus agricola]
MYKGQGQAGTVRLKQDGLLHAYIALRLKQDEPLLAYIALRLKQDSPLLASIGRAKPPVF